MIAELMKRHAEELFLIPYYIAQTAIGEDDGGIASLFEADDQGFRSGFANAGGDRVINALLEYVASDEVVERVAMIRTPDIDQRFESSVSMLEASIGDISDDVTSKWHEALKAAFPEVPAEKIDNQYGFSKDAVSAYLQFQHSYSNEAKQKHNTGMTP